MSTTIGLAGHGECAKRTGTVQFCALSQSAADEAAARTERMLNMMESEVYQRNTNNGMCLSVGGTLKSSWTPEFRCNAFPDISCSASWCFQGAELGYGDVFNKPAVDEEENFDIPKVCCSAWNAIMRQAHSKVCDNVDATKQQAFFDLFHRMGLCTNEAGCITGGSLDADGNWVPPTLSRASHLSKGLSGMLLSSLIALELCAFALVST
eukprot:CAMPEP_0114563474 /NCGR_PEP_ID=MMETSP0114-20121206/13130_1 /TAXON_ID=31324 /ORGANISM="Goniomonas sp, Strain m" /LENGTH=208 /DNA_ID=CAMNT_0001749325 /DNA_START=72 /DNA_END=698 /DNA_ORIENTATION=-